MNRMHLKVLVIEDNEDDAALLARYLNNCGFDPKWQRVDTEAALADAVEDRRWDLVLCDHSMPRLTPFLAVDCVRQINPDIPIIIVTGGITEEIAVRLIQHGIQDIVIKDDLPRLKAVVRRELALAQNRRDKVAAELRLVNALEKLYQGVALYDPDARLIIPQSKIPVAAGPLRTRYRSRHVLFRIVADGCRARPVRSWQGRRRRIAEAHARLSDQQWRTLRAAEP